MATDIPPNFRCACGAVLKWHDYYFLVDKGMPPTEAVNYIVSKVHGQNKQCCISSYVYQPRSKN